VASAAPTWTRRYIGSFIISAWSLSKGTSYIQQGDAVAITRQKPKAAAPPAPAKGTAAKAGKGAKGGKQTKLSFGKAAPAPPPKAPKKMKEDYIVRFNNMRGECCEAAGGWTGRVMAAPLSG
jgi:DNA repair protein RAD5